MSQADEQADIARFRAFVYGAYSETHHVYSGAESEGAGRRLNIRAVLQREFPAGRNASILDFGCGDGLLLSIAQELGYTNLTGVDLSEGLLRTAAGRSSATLHRGDALAFIRQSPAECFDVVVAFDVFEHLTRPELLDAAREIARVLKPRGLLLLHVPNGASPFHGSVRWGDITHEQAFTRSSLAQVLLPLGFASVETQEEALLAHGLKSTVRLLLWYVFRAFSVLRLAAETGQVKGHVLTINMYASAHKAEARGPR